MRLATSSGLIGVEELPDDLAVVCHLKEPPVVRIGDQGVAMGQALVRSARKREKGFGRIGDVFPDDALSQGIEFDHPRAARFAAIVID